MKSEKTGTQRRLRAEILHERRLRAVERAFSGGKMTELLDKYVDACREESAAGEERAGGDTRRGAVKRSAKIPNPAGFCRFLGIEEAAYQRLEREFPTEAGRMRAVFLDEAFNASLSPSVLSLYLKFFFGSEEETGSEEGISVTFEHDILADGE